MTPPSISEGVAVAERVLFELPAAVVVADLKGTILNQNARALRIFGSGDNKLDLCEIGGWRSRSGSLANTLRSVASSSNWTPVALSLGDDRMELKGRGIILEGHAEPVVLLMESPSAPQRFSEHSEQVRQLNAQLMVQRKTEENLEKALRTAKELRHELIHRVKNNLSIISALLRTKARAAEHPAAVEALKAAAARIHSVAVVHDILDAKNETEILTSRVLIIALLDHLREAICPPHVTLECEAFETEIHSETALPLCLLINELVTNSIKHAFKDRASGEIKVTFAPAAEGFCLTVADNGAWADEKPGRKGTGSQIIKVLTQQLGGELEVSHTGGTAFTTQIQPVIQ